MNIADNGGLLGKALGQIDELYFVDTLMRRIARRRSKRSTGRLQSGCARLGAQSGAAQTGRRSLLYLRPRADANLSVWSRADRRSSRHERPFLRSGRIQTDASALRFSRQERTRCTSAAIDEKNSGYYELDDQRTVVVVESRRLFSGTSAVEGRMQFGVERLETTSGRRDPDGKTLYARIGDIVVASGWVIDMEQRLAAGDVFGVVDSDEYVTRRQRNASPRDRSFARHPWRARVRFRAAHPDAHVERRSPRPLARSGRAGKFRL